MLRYAFLAAFLTLATGATAMADTIGFGTGQAPKGFAYSPSSSPFEAFDWTPLDFAAFSAYGGDFANVRRPVTPIRFFEDPILPPAPQGPDDEQLTTRLLSVPVFEKLPAEPQVAYEALPVAGTSSIPEPGIAMMIGVGLLGLSARLRRSTRAR
ncbi:PEP-CTERM sorting domain-containing protein [Luteitalea sp.]